MKSLLDKLHTRIGDLWWYSLMIFVACRSGDVIQAFIGLWLVPKYVGPEELGTVLPLQQLSGLFAVPLAIIATVFSKYVNTYATRREFGKVKSFIRDVLLTSVVVFVVCIIIAYLILPHFYIRLNVSSGMLTVLILAAGFTSNVANLFTSALQGLKKFKAMTLQNLITAPIRLVTLLVAMPFRALSGYVLGQATPPASCSFLAAITLHRALKHFPSDTSWRKDISKIIRYFWPIAIYMAFSALTGTIGMTIYRQRLPEVESSAYYMLSRFAEIAGYAGLSITTILIPLASEAHEKGKEHHASLRYTILATLAITILLAAVFGTTAQTILSANTSWSVYLPYSYLLPILTMIAGLGTAIGAVISYEMACRRFLAAGCLLCTNIFWTVALICLTAPDGLNGILPTDVIDRIRELHIARLAVLSWGSLVLAIAQLILVYLLHTRSSKSRN